MTETTQKTAEEVLAEIVEIFKEYYDPETYHIVHRENCDSLWSRIGGWEENFPLGCAVEKMKKYATDSSFQEEFALKKNEFLLPHFQREDRDDLHEPVARILHDAGYLK